MKLENIIFYFIGLCFISFIGYVVYDTTVNVKEVCETYESKIKYKVHETESINNFGATRNNYYLYLEDHKRIEVDLDEYVYVIEGDVYEYTECWSERIK